MASFSFDVRISWKGTPGLIQSEPVSVIAKQCITALTANKRSK